MSRLAKVLLPLPLPEAFDYAEPPGMTLAPGDHVAVPLGPRLARGVVIAVQEGRRGERPLRPVAERLEDLPLPPTSLDFILWAARYAVEPPGLALAMTLRGLRARPPAARPRLIASVGAPGARTPAQARVLAAAREPLRAAELARAAGVSAAVVRALLKSGALIACEASRTPDAAAAAPRGEPTRLDASQGAAVAAIESIWRAASPPFFSMASPVRGRPRSISKRRPSCSPANPPPRS